ncbi:MAG TPA: VOC family protein [Alphaproteobacteria bacterium]|nr:VOC family protein [Alphaproteobacteria bacterium]
MTVHSLLGYTLRVPDVPAGKRFYEDFGLIGRDYSDRLGFRVADGDAEPVTLTEGKGRRLAHVVLGVAPDQAKPLQQRIEKTGAKLVDPPRAEGNAVFAVRDPEDNLIVLKTCQKAEFLPKRRANIQKVGAGFSRDAAVRGCPPRDGVIRPWRLGHVLMFTTNVDRQIKFYTEALGMKLSDRSGDIIAFIRVPGGSDHHVIAFAKSDRPGFHHASFEVGSVDQVGHGAVRMIDKGWKSGWGFGRHVLGSNYFHYIRDPWNSLAEYFFDIDYIADDAKWEARDWPAEDSLYLWGPNVPPDFVQNFDNA